MKIREQSKATGNLRRIKSLLLLFFRKAGLLPFLVVLAAAAPARPGIDAPALAALGPYGAGVAKLEMAEPTARHITVDVWYPAAAGGSPVTYHSALAGPDGRPTPFSIQGIAVAGAVPAPGRFPLVILAHGYGNTPEAIAWLGENLATKGYVVAAPAFRDPPTFDAPSVMSAVFLRPLDIAFVAAEVQARARAGQAPFARAGQAPYASIDPDRTALIGYSMGAYGVLTAAGAPLAPALAPATRGALAPFVAGAPKADVLKVANVKAVVAISPPGHFGPLPSWPQGGLAAIRVPTFFIVGSQDHTVGYDPGVKTIFENETNAPRYLLTFREAGHNIALSTAPPEMLGRLWDKDWFEDPVWCKSRLIGIEAHFITAFLDRYVKGDTTRASYIDGLVPNSDDGTWKTQPATYGQMSPGAPAATLWKGFQAAHAAGMMLEFRPAGK